MMRLLGNKFLQRSNPACSTTSTVLCVVLSAYQEYWVIHADGLFAVYRFNQSEQSGTTYCNREVAVRTAGKIMLLRPTSWEEAPFSIVQLLPTDARPITRWLDRDEAFQNVVVEINRTIKDLLISLKTKENWLEEGNALSDLKRYEEAEQAYEKACQFGHGSQ